MKFIVRMASIFFILFTSSAGAVTLKYELVNIFSGNDMVSFPGLDFSQASSVTLTVIKEEGKGPVLKNLEVKFPYTSEISAAGFERTYDGKYRALVRNAWVYSQVIVDVDGREFLPMAPLSIEIFVPEHTSVIHPIEETFGPRLLTVGGELRDVTNRRTVDTASLVIAGKRLNLSLKDHLGVPTPESVPQGYGEGFVIECLWMGKGKKTIYFPAPFSGNEIDLASGVGLVIEGVESANPGDLMLSVKYADPQGLEAQTPPQPLLNLLGQAYPL